MLGAFSGRARRRSVLARVGLAGKEHVKAKDLSYGERRALEIGVALAARPRLLFLDEPTAGLGTEATARIARADRRAQALAHHRDDRARHAFLFGLADHIYVMHWGQVIAQGAPAELRANPWVQRSSLGNAMLLAERHRDLLRRDRRRCSASRSRCGAGEVVALLGPNGAGKTTTLRSILGLSSVRTGAHSLRRR